jgi:tripartite-type tricarboxylate transporter receptor subunit TctC
VSGELFKMMTGINVVHVPYRGGAPALTDLISGQVQVMFDNVPTSIEFIRAGKLRPLAVTTAARSHLLPDLPTVADFVPGYEASAWYGLGVPRGTPEVIVDRLNTEINAILADPKPKARFAELGASRMQVRPPSSGSSSPMKPRSGPRWSSSPAPSRIRTSATESGRTVLSSPAARDRAAP